MLAKRRSRRSPLPSTNWINVDFKTIHLKDIFGSNVFSEAEMQSRLPKPVFKSLMKTIHEGAPFEPAIADAVAAAMRDWAWNMVRLTTPICSSR